MYLNIEFSPYWAAASTSAPVTSRLIRVSGRQNFQLNAMTWSYRGRGIEARSRMKIMTKKQVLSANQKNGICGRMPNGPCQPPKNRDTSSAEMGKIGR